MTEIGMTKAYKLDVILSLRLPWPQGRRRQKMFIVTQEETLNIFLSSIFLP
jgi:hypothetical protein